MITTNLFHLKGNTVINGKFKTHICRRSKFSQVGNFKVQKIFLGIMVHCTVLLQHKLFFESEANETYAVHMWKSKLVKYKFVIYNYT